MRSKPRIWMLVILATLATPALTLPLASAATTRKSTKGLPRATTGGAKRLAGSSAELTAVIEPNGIATSYYFQWGPTITYGSQTPTTSAGNGTAKVKVGQTINNLTQGTLYHFRVVALYTNPKTGIPSTFVGRDRSFAIKGQVKFELPKIAPVPYGGTFILSGTMHGLDAANHMLALQASAYPATAAFTTIALPATTDARGHFAFRVSHLTSTTSFRVVTVDPRPIYSPVISVQASAVVVLHVRAGSAKTGLVRLYGTITPALAGQQLLIQLEEPIKSKRPTKSEATSRYRTQFATRTKPAGRTHSRFSIVVKVLTTGRYRAYIKLRPGAIASGTSASVVLRAGPKRHKTKK